jgi:hypothetical protein
MTVIRLILGIMPSTIHHLSAFEILLRQEPLQQALLATDPSKSGFVATSRFIFFILNQSDHISDWQSTAHKSGRWYINPRIQPKSANFDRTLNLQLYNSTFDDSLTKPDG